MPASRDLLDTWLDHRCGPKDQIALWYGVYKQGRDAGCLRYDADLLLNLSYADAYHTERPSLNYLFRRCRGFRFACGRQFVMPEMLHEGAFSREDGVAVGDPSFLVAPRRDGSAVLDEADVARLGLAGIDHSAWYGDDRALGTA